MIKEYPQIEGRTFFVGDIHGCFKEFLDELIKVYFDYTKDRVFSVGDLTDRGPNNMECLRLLNMPWFHAVRGNHDDLIVGSLQGSSAHRDCWLNNGGDWALKLSYDEREELYNDLLPMLEALPYIIRIGDVAMLHAECTAASLDDLELDDAHMLTWGRSIIRSGVGGIVGGAKHIVVGHSVVPDPVRLGNHVFIDTGAVFGNNCNVGRGRLTLIEMEDIPKVKEVV
jgi:serine/threonine protein phosphatase 1